MNKKCKCLGLPPDDLLRKVYRDNALKYLSWLNQVAETVVIGNYTRSQIG
jgi:hypothetical protein